MPEETPKKQLSETARTAVTQSTLAPVTVLVTYFAAEAFLGRKPELAEHPEILAGLAGAVATLVQGGLTAVAQAARNVLRNTKWGAIILGALMA